MLTRRETLEDKTLKDKFGEWVKDNPKYRKRRINVHKEY